MEIYLVLEDGQPIKASENYDRLASWVRKYAEQTFDENYKDDAESDDEAEVELNIDGLEASITIYGETQWELTSETVNLI